MHWWFQLHVLCVQWLEALIWSHFCPFIQVQAGRLAATQRVRDVCWFCLRHHAFSVALCVYDWIRLKWCAGTVCCMLVVHVVAASLNHRLKISFTTLWFTGMCPYCRSMSVTVRVIGIEIHAQEHFNKSQRVCQASPTPEHAYNTCNLQDRRRIYFPNASQVVVKKYNFLEDLWSKLVCWSNDHQITAMNYIFTKGYACSM